jgi:hypothetical protein
MCSAIQAITRSEAGVPRSGSVVQRSAAETLVPRTCGIICRFGILPTNGAGEEMRIDLANPINVWRHLRVFETCARKSTKPLLCG